MRIAIRTLQLSAAVVALALLASSRPIAQTPAVTIDALMAAPFPTDLVAAPTGGGIAWVSSVSGVVRFLPGNLREVVGSSGWTRAKPRGQRPRAMPEDRPRATNERTANEWLLGLDSNQQPSG
jgi:hypothetical protein